MVSEAQQMALPGLGRIYRSVAGARRLGPARYHRHLVFLACLEMRSEPFSVRDRKQAKVRERTRDIHLRHFPRDDGFPGVPERSIRRDKLRASRWVRALRGLDQPKLRPDDAALRQLEPAALLDEIARRDLRVQELEARCERLLIELGVLKAELLGAEVLVPGTRSA